MTTAATFGCASARDVSIERILACAYGLRRIAPCTIPGSLMSSRYLPWPRMKRASSLRLRRPKPIGRSWCGGHAQTSCLRFVLGGPAGRGDDVLVARAAADAARDRGADLVLARVGVGVQQRPDGHHHPRRAEAALERVQLVEALLHRVQLPVDLERLHGADLVAGGHRREDRAGLDRLVVHEHDAGAAVGRVAAPVGAGEVERLAQEVHEQLARLDVARHRLAVHGHRDVHAQASSFSARAVARRSARPQSTPARWRL